MPTAPHRQTRSRSSLPRPRRWKCDRVQYTRYYFVYNPLKFNLGCFLKLFYVLFLSYVLFLFVSCSPSQQKPMPQTEAVAWLPCRRSQKKNQLHRTVFSCGDAFSWISLELTVIRCVMPPQKWDQIISAMYIFCTTASAKLSSNWEMPDAGE